MHGRGRSERLHRLYQWPHYALAVAASLLLFGLRGESPAATPLAQLFDRIDAHFVAGRLALAEAEAHDAEPLLLHASPGTVEQFHLQHARIEFYGGRTREALKLLQAIPAAAAATATSAAAGPLAAMRGTLLAFAYTRLGDLPHARLALAEAERCATDDASRANVLAARGLMDIKDGRLEDAERSFTLSLGSATSAGDSFQQAQALLNLGVVSLRQEHYEDALDRFDRASHLAQSIGARLAAEKALGNVGFSFYKLGDFRRALAAAEAAEKEAEELGSPIDQAGLLTDVGLDQFRLGNLGAAQRSYERSDQLARSIGNFEEIVDAQVALGYLAIQQAALPAALAHAAEAISVAGQHLDESQRVQPALLQALALSRLNRFDQARDRLLALDRQVAAKASDRWKVEGALAQLAADTGDRVEASRRFEQAIATFHLQRASFRRVESRLPFLETGNDLYLGYMEELIRQGRVDDALRILDRSRAETLTEGLGLGPARQPANPSAALQPPALRPTALAQRLHGTLLVYCLRPETSYLWAVTTSSSTLFRLPGKAQIDALVESHTRAILDARDLLTDGNAPGRTLYNLLVAPAQAMIPAGGTVFVVPDEALHRLNFETLIAGGQPDNEPRAPGTRPHFWIEDAAIANSASLSLLAAQAPRPSSARTLLLIGDPASAGDSAPKLPHAPREIAGIAARFPAADRLVLTGAQASPAAYEGSDPARFRFIHFVAHGTASELNPLDSAVLLSPPAGTAAGKLYARTILDHRLSAELVTISACFGSGTRAYSGEGLVGLAWAFLRAGSHNVIASLWEVSDAATPELMDGLYRQLAAGATPAAALRDAKLAMLHSTGVFRKPIYWAPFQLYSGA